MQPPAISVTEFLGIINETLAFAYPAVTVEGEVSSFKVNQGKFVFFDLKDEQNLLSCFMMVHQLQLPLEDGMKIRVTGNVKVTKFSKFSLTARSIELAGEGELRRAMELLRKKLEAEGLFDDSRKRPLPKFPQRIGLITSGTSAAYSDFMKILDARWSGVTVELADVSVQGAAAPDQIVAALEYFNGAAQPPDVVAIIRGGGSLEDLAAFSTEPVARAIAASRAPIIVGVGHEIDVSLADYAADVRAATPTDAARLIVPDRTEMSAHIQHLAGRLENGTTGAIAARQRELERHVATLERHVRLPGEQIASLEHRLQLAGRSAIARQNQRLTALERTLRSFDPQANLNRGYAIVRHDQRIVRTSHNIKTGDSLVIQLAKGTLSAQVGEKSK